MFDMVKCMKCPHIIKKIEDLCDQCLADYDEHLLARHTDLEQGRLEMEDAQAQEFQWRKAE